MAIITRSPLGLASLQADDRGDAPPPRDRFISSSATRPVALMLVVRMWQFGSEGEIETTRINDG
jgi:hypothetical protein